MDKPEKELPEKIIQEKDLSEKNDQKELSFECFICLEKRFVAFRPPCGHKICGVCVLKTLNTDGLHNKCGMCRANLPENLDDYSCELHNIADLKSEEFEYAAETATRKGNLPVLKNLLSQNNFAVGESVRVVDLKYPIDLNGSEGVIKKLFSTSERHTVLLECKIEPKNLRHPKLEEKCVRIAAECGQIEIVKFLAEQKADLNQANNNGVTPIFVAAQNGRIEIVKFLAEQKADLNQTSNNGATPILIAAQHGHFEIVNFLAGQKADLDRAKNDGATPMFVAAGNGHIEIVKFLAEQKTDLNRAKNNGATPVCIAVAYGHMEIVKFLAGQKADLNQSNNSGVTPLLIAAYHGHTEIVKFLAQENIDLNWELNDGGTPILIAVERCHAEIVNILIEANANVEESLLSIETTDEINKILWKALEKK